MYILLVSIHTYIFIDLCTSYFFTYVHTTTATHCNIQLLHCSIQSRQRTATYNYCNALQHTTTPMHCNIQLLHRTATHDCCKALQHTYEHCNALQCTTTAAHCNIQPLQHTTTATHCNMRLVQLTATNVCGLLWKLVGNFGSRNYFRSASSVCGLSSIAISWRLLQLTTTRCNSRLYRLLSSLL